MTCKKKWYVCPLGCDEMLPSCDIIFEQVKKKVRNATSVAFGYLPYGMRQKHQNQKLMKKITLLLLFCITAGYSQNFQWLQTPEINFNLNPDGISYPLATDGSGNVYMAGYKENPVPYNDVMGTVFYNKYGENGNLIYTKTLSGEVTVYEMATDNAGNLLMAAGYTNSINFDNISILTINQGVQFLMIKFDPDGNLVWYKPIEIQDSFVNDFRTIITDSQNNIYIGYDDYQHSYISKMNAAGEEQMLITQQYAKMVSSISIDDQGNIYAAGACAESIATYGGVSAPTTFGYNTFAVKYSPTGAFQWIKYVEDVTCPFPQIKARTPDEVYFSSYLFGSYAFGPITSEGPIDGGFSDFFLAKLNHEGEYQWVREVDGGGKVITGKKNFLELDSEGNIYFAGATQGTVNWGNGITTTADSFMDDAVLVKYDTNGTVLMAVTAGGSSYDRTDSVRVAADGSVFLSGMANGNANFGDLSHNAGEFQNYPYLTRITNAPLNVPQNSDIEFSIYPNPASSVLHFSTSTILNGSIFNMVGQRMNDFTVQPGQSIDISALAQGSYILKAHGKVLKFVKN